MILALLLATGIETANFSQKSKNNNILIIVGGAFLSDLFTLLPAWLRARQPRKHGKTLKIHWFLRVESHMRLFGATPETT